MQQKLSPVLNEKEIIKASDAIDKALENINNSIEFTYFMNK